MLLRKVVRQQVVEYLASSHWQRFMEVLRRGGEEVLHAHIYADSILHPRSVERALRGYFERLGLPLRRRVGLLSHGRGMTNVYYIQPEGMCHFEVLLRFNPEVVWEPMPEAVTRSGRNIEFWDRAYMEAYYGRFAFAPVTESDRSEIRAYFESEAWKRLYAAMIYENERNFHGHAIVETRFHPEEILPLGKEALEARGWSVDRAVSIVFGLNGMDQGKISYLLSKPEVVLELEWEFNPNVAIRPAVVPVARVTTGEMVRRDMEQIPYIELDEEDCEWIVRRAAR